MSINAISGEQTSTTFIVVCESEADTTHLAALLEQQGLDTNQYDVISPNEKKYSRKLEPETTGVAKTAIKAHAVFGGIGFVIGLGIWGILRLSHIELIESSPWLVLIPLLFFSTIAGLMVGGLITLRPDHQLAIQTVKNARKKGQWSMVIHSRNSHQSDFLMQELTKANIHFVRTL